MNIRKMTQGERINSGAIDKPQSLSKQLEEHRQETKMEARVVFKEGAGWEVKCHPSSLSVIFHNQIQKNSLRSLMTPTANPSGKHLSGQSAMGRQMCNCLHCDLWAARDPPIRPDPACHFQERLIKKLGQCNLCSLVYDLTLLSCCCFYV